MWSMNVDWKGSPPSTRINREGWEPQEREQVTVNALGRNISNRPKRKFFGEWLGVEGASELFWSRWSCWDGVLEVETTKGNHSEEKSKVQGGKRKRR
jgi:hypothetical protein